MKYLILILLFSLRCLVWAQSENPYKDVPVDRLESHVVASFERFDFLESVCSDKAGVIYTSNLVKGDLYAINGKEVSTLFHIDGLLAGLVILDRSHLLVTGNNSDNLPVIIKVNTQTGKHSTLYTHTERGMFNGIRSFNKNEEYLIADSFSGTLFRFDVHTQELHVWVHDELLGRRSSASVNPGANGLKVLNDRVYVNNTDKMTMLSIPILKNNAAGLPQVIKDNVMIDDFEVDADGNVYAATQEFDSVIKIKPSGDVRIVAQSDQGVAGAACVRFKKGTNNILLVSTNGGILKNNKCDVVPAKIVSLHLK